LSKGGRTVACINRHWEEKLLQGGYKVWLVERRKNSRQQSTRSLNPRSIAAYPKTIFGHKECKLGSEAVYKEPWDKS
jgi:hypothetical protein